MTEEQKERLLLISFNLAVDEKMKKPPSMPMRDALWLVEMVEQLDKALREAI